MSHEPIIQTRARPKGEKRRRGWSMILFVIGTLALLILVPFFILRPREDVYLLRSFETAPVETGTLLEFERGTGTLVPRLQRSLLAPGKGVLAEWRVAEGDEVKQGDSLGSLRSSDLQDKVSAQEQALGDAQRALETLTLEQDVAVREAQDALSALQTTLTDATRTRKSTQRLFDIGAASQAELETAQAAEASAQQAVENAQANQTTEGESRTLAQSGAQSAIERAQQELTNAQAQADALTLLAPITGRVLKLEVAVGDTVEDGALLVTLASPNDLRIEAALDEAAARSVGTGQKANITVAGQTFKGSVTQVGAQAEAGSDGSAATVPVVLNFNKVPPGLRIGASAAVEIEVGRRENALCLPRGPYLTTGGERFAYVVDGETATRQNVLFGLIDGERVEVTDGLSAGQRIVTSSYEAFKDREAIRLAPEGEIK